MDAGVRRGNTVETEPSGLILESEADSGKNINVWRSKDKDRSSGGEQGKKAR